MNLYLDPLPLVFCAGAVAGWVSLIAIVYGLAALQRRRNRRPQ